MAGDGACRRHRWWRRFRHVLCKRVGVPDAMGTSRLLVRSVLFDLVFPEPAVEGTPADAQDTGGPGFVPLSLFQRLQNGGTAVGGERGAPFFQEIGPYLRGNPPADLLR